MKRVMGADIIRTLYYLMRHGPIKTWYVANERLARRKRERKWKPLPKRMLDEQRRQWEQRECPIMFSIVVPAYRTKEAYLKALVVSLLCQTYPKWELILADASEGDEVERVVTSIQDERIRYFRLEKNGGISENTNRALEWATGDYVGLLDHDDVLVQEALFEMERHIEMAQQRGIALKMLYSDQDKCNGDGTDFFESYYKEDFNLDLLLSNNYICHFLVMERELIQDLRFRPEYDGAQDYDLILRAVDRLLGKEELICHIPKVLYHWRCHSGSTAANPRSKSYAYEAGRRAVEDFARRRGWDVEVKETTHSGFYKLCYKNGLFETRQDVGAAGGRVVRKGIIVSGRMIKEGLRYHRNFPIRFNGYWNRAIIAQDAVAIDIRNMKVREECREIFRRVTGVPYKTLPKRDIFDTSLLPADCNFITLSLELCAAFREAGYRILYLPTIIPDKKVPRRDTMWDGDIYCNINYVARFFKDLIYWRGEFLLWWLWRRW